MQTNSPRRELVGGALAKALSRVPIPATEGARRAVMHGVPTTPLTTVRVTYF